MFVYFVSDGVDGPIKIGRTANVRRRLTNMQTASPTRLHLLAATEALDEKELHARFAAHRLVGEWFRRVPEIVKFAESIGVDPRLMTPRERCLYLGIPVMTIARVTGLPQPIVHRWSRREHTPSLANLARIMAAFPAITLQAVFDYHGIISESSPTAPPASGTTTGEHAA